MSKLIFVFPMVMSGLLLSACGQKGALYLPKTNTPVVSPQPIPTDDSQQPAISENSQNPNVDTQIPQGNTNDY